MFPGEDPNGIALDPYIFMLVSDVLVQFSELSDEVMFMPVMINVVNDAGHVEGKLPTNP